MFTHRIPLGAACIVFVFWLAMAGISPASITFNSLASFNGTSGNGPNHTALIQATDGNLWGNTVGGGANSQGEVFKISPSGTLTTVYSFCSLSGCADGAQPYGPLMQASNGDFYGTTLLGGANNYGTVFKLTSTGTLTTLYSFCAQASCTDGEYPEGVLAQDSAGNFYGTTYSGGASDDGTVFKLTQDGVLTTLHTFSGLDGALPTGGLIAANGAFYGTAQANGVNGEGTVFKITSTGTFTTLYSFCSQTNCTDGTTPVGWMVDVSGNFYGTTQSGGANGQGTVFKMTPAGTVTTVYSFCSLASCADGAEPTAGLMAGTDGNLYGLTDGGGANGDGTAYKLTLKGVLTTLHSFDGTDGANPVGGLVQDTNGDFYGMTSGGGANGYGTVFSIATGLKAFVTLERTSGKVGSEVGILGDGFTSSSVVKFNGVTATSTLTEPGLLTATVPTGATNGYVTVTTGTTTLKSSQKYTVHNSWASGTAIPTAVNYPAGTGVVGTRIYVVGGATASGNITTNQVYNTSNNTWSTEAALPTALAGSSAAVVKNILYIFGGYSGSTAGTAVDSVYAYDPTTNAWTAEASMPTARGSSTAVVDGTTVYVIGGNNSTLRLNTVEAYDTVSNTWSEEAPLLTGKSDLAGGLLGTTVLATDGYNASTEDNGDNEAYDVSTNSWSTLASDPNPRNSMCYGTVGSLLYVAGGVNGNNTPLDTSESFSASANKWTTLAAEPVAAVAPGSAVAGGQLYCISGSSSSLLGQGTLYNNVQIYQP